MILPLALARRLLPRVGCGLERAVPREHLVDGHALAHREQDLVPIGAGAVLLGLADLPDLDAVASIASSRAP